MTARNGHRANDERGTKRFESGPFDEKLFNASLAEQKEKTWAPQIAVLGTAIAVIAGLALACS